MVRPILLLHNFRNQFFSFIHFFLICINDCHLIFNWPSMVSDNWKSEFDAFPWAADDAAYLAWTKGMTGYPLVDAGMRELWQTGWMHNRVRMVAASFLIKHLMIDWRRGAEWFEDTLVDADLAVNRASWQWVAGSGADAAPYFRIFNPVLQGEKFDPAGDYVRRYVPELAGLDARVDARLADRLGRKVRGRRVRVDDASRGDAGAAAPGEP